jgi:hypothetical protein
MKSRFLFPHQFKIYGWVITIPSIILGVLVIFKDLNLNIFDITFPYQFKFSNSINHYKTSGTFTNQTSTFNFTDEIATFGTIVGLILIAFSKLKVEDEYVSKIRLESLQWAIYVNYGLLVTATILVHELAFFNVMIFNMFTPLLFFVIRFHFILFLKPSFEKN